MSYILDALRKSESERHQGEVPNLGASSMLIHAQRDQRPLWPYLLIGVLVLNAVLLGIWLTMSHNGAPATTAATADAQVGAAAAATPTAKASPVQSGAQQSTNIGSGSSQQRAQAATQQPATMPQGYAPAPAALPQQPANYPPQPGYYPPPQGYSQQPGYAQAQGYSQAQGYQQPQGYPPQQPYAQQNSGYVAPPANSARGYAPQTYAPPPGYARPAYNDPNYVPPNAQSNGYQGELITPNQVPPGNINGVAVQPQIDPVTGMVRAPNPGQESQVITPQLARQSLGYGNQYAAPQATEPASSVADLSAATPAVDVPRLEDLSIGFQRRVPSMQFNSHIYASDPSARRVMINNVYLREGQQYQGMLIQEITDSGVVMVLDGVVFEVNASRDWVTP